MAKITPHLGARKKKHEIESLVDVSDIFYFLLLGEGEVGVRGEGGWGVDFY